MREVYLNYLSNNPTSGFAVQREEIIYTGCAKIFRYTNSQKYVGNKIKMVELSIRREIKKIGKFSSFLPFQYQ